MSDKYLSFAQSGPGKFLAKKLGLPNPTPLKRYQVGDPVAAGPVIVLGSGADADTVANALLEWDVDVRRHLDDAGLRPAAVIIVWTEVATPGDLRTAALAAGPAVRALAKHGRVITIGRDDTAVTTDGGEAGAVAVAAARAGVTGFTRSVAKELRYASTANGIVLGESVPVDATPAVAALRFLLSRKSAFVDGQFITVDSADGAAPDDWGIPLAGKVAVVTGAARGIGAAIVEVLSRDGAKVIAVDVPAAGESLTKTANRHGATALQLDVTSPDAAARITEVSTGRYGHLDIVVHNAGITRDKLLVNMSEDRWDSVIGVNIEAPLAITRDLLAGGHLASGARVVSLASTSGIAGNRGQTNYAASKSGVIGATRVLADALTDIEGTANAVAPGLIETEMTAKMPAMTRQLARRTASLQLGGSPVDVAEAIAFFSSPAITGIRGHTLRVCGQNIVGA